MLFGYFWTAEFIEACGQAITAMCMCCYYFTRDKSRINNLTICHAAWVRQGFGRGREGLRRGDALSWEQAALLPALSGVRLGPRTTRQIIARYHMGTLAFGSLLVAMVRLLRAYLRYMERYAMRNRTCLQKIILKCIQ